MPRELDPRRIEVLDPLVAIALRRMTPQQRIEMVFDAHDTAREIATCSVRRRHPDWDDEQVAREVGRRLLRAAGVDLPSV